MLEVDFNSLMKSISGTITGRIFITLDSYHFPEKEWNDFVIILLNWWLEEINTNFLYNNEGTFYFMDGSYKFTIIGKDKVLVFKFFEQDKLILEEITQKANFFSSLKKTVNALLRFFKENNWDNKEIDKLSKNYNELCINLKKKDF